MEYVDCSFIRVTMCLCPVVHILANGVWSTLLHRESMLRYFVLLIFLLSNGGQNNILYSLIVRFYTNSQFIMVVQSFSDDTEVVPSSPYVENSPFQSQSQQSSFTEAINQLNIPPELEVVFGPTQAKKAICYPCDAAKQIVFNTYWRETSFGSKLQGQEQAQYWGQENRISGVWDHYELIAEIPSGNTCWIYI